MGVSRYKFPFKYNRGDGASPSFISDYDDTVVAQFWDDGTCDLVVGMLNDYVNWGKT
jgi:hypothetical protein